MVSIVIVTHGEFGAYLLEAAEEIVGRPAEQCVVVAAISRRLSLPEVRQKIEAAITEAVKSSGSEGVLALCDMLGGTPCNETLLLARKYPKIEVLAGVNLYMIISALMNSRRLGLESLLSKVLEDSRRSVANAREIFLSKSGSVKE
ncbi:MAG: hypothetical protein HYT79_06360 [Elusimicrobia bacterium]|nr:hypothetical protein [Elusimicrobiota bacterium]